MSSNFLSKLKSEGKLELVEPSEQIFKSYNYKAKNYLGAAKVVQNAKYYESAISEAYYSMYNSVQSLLFICGIKCENHSAAAILLKKLFKLNNLFNIFSIAKEERIDKQYYVTTQ